MPSVHDRCTIAYSLCSNAQTSRICCKKHNHYRCPHSVPMHVCLYDYISLQDSGSHTSNEEEEDEDRKRHSRLKTHPWTFEGCISGHVPLEWRVVSIS
jgi:hypothetical protein